MIIPDYEIIQELSSDSRHTLYRGRLVADLTAVLIKTPRRLPPSLADVELLEREFNLLRDLSVDGVVRARDLLRYEGGCCLLLEDAGLLPLEQMLAFYRSDLDSFFKLAVQLSTTLAELHRRDVIHRSISPRNILAHPRTGEARLADFGLASRAASESHPHSVNELSNDALSYISPEQTGRMNRAIDYRSDLYSLGVTFYELLTGVRPFHSDDTLEIIHGHVAKMPPPPSEINPNLPDPLSQIVMKLLSKTAEQRYQSALGLTRDLRRCADDWAAHRRIAPFALAERDVPDRFVVSQKLYGRDREVAALLNAFDRVCDGNSQVMLVAGYSGIGKTSLIHELYKPIVRQRGYFIAGKFDQIARGIPFSALIQAFRGFIEQLLTESEDRLQSWRARLSGAIESNGGVIAEVIPEIELILGEQPAAPAIAPTEAQNRFQLVFQNFVGAIARKEHPLVIFLDDLQWADSATLGLLHSLVASRDVQSLFLIGAYRDNEVDAAHPLARALDDIEREAIRLRRVTLGPFALDDLALLICDTIHREPPEVEPLARLVLQKTGGNPFFVIQFLKSLWQSQLIEFDYDQGRWAFDMEAIARAEMTDNVIDLMTRKIQRLSPKAQTALTLAACIGSRFDVNTLAIVSRQANEAATADLGEAVDEGLILPVGSSHESTAGVATSEIQLSAGYAFMHDRVQQAAYALIPDGQKQLAHLTIGRLLLGKRAGDAEEEKSFEIANHLNIGKDLIDERSERLSLARLNLSAGRRAKSSTAYESALFYFKTGAALLSEDHWESDYALAFALRIEAAECCYLCGQFDEAEGEIELLIARAATNLDRARAYILRIVQHENLSRYAEALSSASESLTLFGVSFPDSLEAKQSALEAEALAIQVLLGNRAIDSLINLPQMTDPEIRMVMSILMAMWPSAYLSGDQALTRLISATMVRLSLVYGNAEESAYGYVTHAITVGPVRGDYSSAYELGRLALEVNQRFDDSKRRAKIYQQFQAHVNPWRQPLETCIPHAREACRSGLESGDFTYAVYGAFTESWPALLSSQNLAAFVRDCSPRLALIRKLRADNFAEAMQVMLNWARALEGKTAAPFSLSDEEFSESDYQEKYGDNPFFAMFYAAARLHLCYLLGDRQEALEISRQARGLADHLSGTIWPFWLEFWRGLTLAANYTAASEGDRVLYLEEMQQARSSLEVLAANCADNFLCHALLLAAEIERVTGRELSAIESYERAVAFAEQTDNIQHRALANELSARFWLGRGQQNLASVFMAEARSCYSWWGATAKVEELDRKHHELLSRHATRSSQASAQSAASQASGESKTESLDVVTAMRAAQAVAGESELERLLARLLRIAIENAGAERGSLIFEQEGNAFVYAEGTTDAIQVKMHEPVSLDRATTLPAGIVNYVRRTSQSVVLKDASSDDRYASDSYIAARGALSILCAPVLKQGRLIGVLYLENNLTTGAFTDDRIKLLQLITSEAAISIENARLYDEMKQEAARRSQAEQTLRSIVEGTSAVTGSDFFSSLVRHLASALKVRYAFVTECRISQTTVARTLALWAGEGLGENIEFDVRATPCQKVLAGEVCHYSEDLQQIFPEDIGLVEWQAESYLGIPISDSAGEIIGHLAVLDSQPMKDATKSAPILKIFAARAGAELERLEAERELREALDEVERLKNRLQAENVYLQEEIRREHNFEEIVGNSPALLETLANVERVARTDSTVLILGETGTGKELIARAVHNLSARKDRPLVKVNCGAISAGLVESELFGHVKGAFTGAVDKRTGRFEIANGGTLFLDEVGELPLETQVKLLRVLQEGEFEPVGSSRTVRVDVRIIAATNRYLEEAVREGRFRADLFYRLNVFPLRVPALRERPTDVPLLVMFFLSRFAKKFGKQVEGVSQETMDLLMNYEWPGNIRELQNIIERAVVLSQTTVLKLGRDLLPIQSSGTAVQHKIESPAALAASAGGAATSQALPTLEEMERRHILAALAQAGGVVEGPKGAARILNLHPNTLRSRMKKLGIQRSGYDIS